MITRYDLYQVHPAGQQQRGEMKENKTGEFVAYEDVMHFLPGVAQTRAALVEHVAAAIAEANVGYSLRLTRLVDGESEYTLILEDGSEPLVFPDHAEGYQHVRDRQYTARAEAAIAATVGFELFVAAAEQPAHDGEK